jgi:plastocyanin
MKMFRGRPWVFVVALTVVAATLFLGLRGVAAQDGAAVNIIDFAFEPATVEIPVGATVTWTNSGGAPHTATANDGAFNSGTLQPGGTFSHTFAAAGSFSYFCEIHPQMTGTVTVTDGAAAPEAAPAAEEATPADAQAAGAGAEADDDDDAAAAQPVQVPRTGVGTTALSGASGGIAFLAALAAALLGVAAMVAYRRA